ncbi:MAG: hypothetical protein IOD05_20085 [Rhodobacter sp.]|nr:hypothetical protein [Rhodobacter sp.]MCA3492894.1 hypothetical protein [Rhodobacter sp.]MCA3501439.1 hypothetical protein [Rhodobacter sp.]MCA3505507.1 hypothetical protein [Rhodobacter sp.]MCA3517149.1 hypothetical protein [Rhodobacter sp.]
MEGGVARVRKRRLIWRGFLIVILVVVVDILAANLADRTLRTRDQFFETIVAEADLAYKTSEETGSFLYQECAWYRVLLVYWARTCFGRSGSRLPRLYGDQSVLHLYYWSPLPLSMLWYSDLHFDAPGRQIILYVTRMNEIVRDLRNE